MFTVTIQPSGSVVTTLGGDARFQCIPTTSQDNVQWLMNSSAAFLNELGNAVVTRVPFSSTVIWLIVHKRKRSSNKMYNSISSCMCGLSS